jgi:uncharacterized protein
MGVGCFFSATSPQLVPAPGGLLKSLAEVRNVAISKELLDILVCPLCKTPVKLTPDEQGLKCSTCRRVYPIRDGIPTMIVDEATIEAE